VRQGRPGDAIELATVAEQAAAEDDVAALAVSRAARAEALAAGGGGAGEAEALARDAVRLAETTDELNLQGQALASLGAVLAAAGRTDEAAAASDAGAERFRLRGNTAALAACAAARQR
jgi:hypothetical protein